MVLARPAATTLFSKNAVFPVKFEVFDLLDGYGAAGMLLAPSKEAFYVYDSARQHRPQE